MAVLQALAVAGQVMGAYGAYKSAQAQGAAVRQQAITDRVRAEAVLDDLEFARIELDMTGTQIGMADRAIAAQLEGQDARLGKLSLDRQMIDLEAEQSEQALRLGLRLRQGEEIVGAVAMGIDPFASASFATMATEMRRQAEQGVANIRLNAAAAGAQNTLEAANEFASQAALLQQRGALAIEEMNTARSVISLAHQERMANYTIKVANNGMAAGSQMMRNAWISGASSLFSAYSANNGVNPFRAGVNRVAGQAYEGFSWLRSKL
jgi:hypothetical protein